jgi:hypothetical protein
MVKIKHLKKLIATKYGLDDQFLVNMSFPSHEALSPDLAFSKVYVIYNMEVIPEEYTLIDCAYLYNWRKV